MFFLSENQELNSNMLQNAHACKKHVAQTRFEFQHKLEFCSFGKAEVTKRFHLVQ